MGKGMQRLENPALPRIGFKGKRQCAVFSELVPSQRTVCRESKPSSRTGSRIMIRFGNDRIFVRPRFPESPSASRLGATMHARHRVSLIRVQSDAKRRQGLGDDGFAAVMWACACNPLSIVPSVQTTRKSGVYRRRRPSCSNRIVPGCAVNTAPASLSCSTSRSPVRAHFHAPPGRSRGIGSRSHGTDG